MDLDKKGTHVKQPNQTHFHAKLSYLKIMNTHLRNDPTHHCSDARVRVRRVRKLYFKSVQWTNKTITFPNECLPCNKKMLLNLVEKMKFYTYLYIIKQLLTLGPSHLSIPLIYIKMTFFLDSIQKNLIETYTDISVMLRSCRGSVSSHLYFNQDHYFDVIMVRWRLKSPPDCYSTVHSGADKRKHQSDGVLNHQPRDCLLNRSFRRRSKKTFKLRVTGLCAGNSPVTGEFPAQRASTADNASIWLRHHGMVNILCMQRSTGGLTLITKSDVFSCHSMTRWHF